MVFLALKGDRFRGYRGDSCCCYTMSVYFLTKTFVGSDREPEELHDFGLVGSDAVSVKGYLQSHDQPAVGIVAQVKTMRPPV
jgi:hypothetical protein